MKLFDGSRMLEDEEIDSLSFSDKKEIYIMSPKTCIFCKDDNGMAEDATPNAPLFKKCDHKISVGILELELAITNERLKELKKAKRYSKLIKEECGYCHRLKL